MEDTNNILSRYERAKTRLLDRGILTAGTKHEEYRINKHNLALVREFMAFKETQARKVYGTDIEAKIRYTKSLYKLLTTYLSNVLFWFNDVKLTDITEAQLEKVYDGLENGKIKSVQDKKLKDITLSDIYSRIFKGEFFRFIKKEDVAKAVILRKYAPHEEVRFFDFATMKKISTATRSPVHKLAWWLLFDTGVEVMALCQLKKGDFELREDKQNKLKYYVLRVPKEIAKKGRRMRVMQVYHTETYEQLETYLATLEQGQKLFDFQPFALNMALGRLNQVHHFKTLPHGREVAIKDFRSSCATFFLSKGWSTDEVKARLGHVPSSDEIDKYVNYLGLNFERRREEDIRVDFNNYKELYEDTKEQLTAQASEMATIKENYERLNKLMMVMMQPDYDRMLDETAGK